MVDFDDPSSIRVRPGSVRTTLIRPHTTVTNPPITDCGSLFEAHQVTEFGGALATWNLPEVAKTVAATFQACPLAIANIYVVAKPKGNPPEEDAVGHAEEDAVERADKLKQALMNQIGPNRFTEDRYYAGATSSNANGAEAEVWLGSKPKVIGGADTAEPAPRAEVGTQVGVQAGGGATRHFSLTPGPPLPPLEWVNQVQAFITKQFHEKNKSGPETQLSIIAQYSFTANQWTLSVSGTGQYTFQLSDQIQSAFLLQVQGGSTAGPGASNQASAAAGASLQVAPITKARDWFAIVAQVTGGPTVQSGGASSFDVGFTISFQLTQ
jgi:hypothetical protein